MPAGMPPLLSVIIVAYRSRDEIRGCLGSLPAVLLARPVEVVVVDNGDDGTGAIVRRDFPHVAYTAPAVNLGFGRANNLGFAQTAGELVLFLNPDTVCHEAALAHCARRALAEPRLGLISPRLELADGSMDLACRRGIPTLWDGFCRASGLAAAFPGLRWFSGYNLTHRDPRGTYPVGAINGAFMLGRRDVLRAVAVRPGGDEVFDERFFMYGDDLDLCIRVGRAGRDVIYDGTQAIRHLKGRSVAKEYPAMSEAIFDANRDIFLKHFGKSAPARWKYRAAFAAWKGWARLRARRRGHTAVRPL